MRIVHLSDFHLDKNEINKSRKLVDKIIDELEKVNQEKKIDLIIFSGDAINKGGYSFGSISKAMAAFKMIFIDTIIQKIDIPAERFIFTIGNHDIDRDADSEFTENGLTEGLNSLESLDKFLSSPKSIRDINRVSDFKDFENKYYKGILKNNYISTPWQSNFKLNIGDKKIGITSLNSSWRCWDSTTDKGKILLGREQIIESKEFLKDCDIKIAISHHHYSWMANFEINCLDKLISSNYDMYFSGHTHSPNVEYCIKPIGRIFNFVSPGVLSKNILISEDDYRNGFSVIDYSTEVGKMNISYYMQEVLSSSFRIDKSIGDNGVWSVDIPMGEEARKRMETQNLILNIKENINELNEHLLSYKTLTNAPKSLNDIFVMPNLVKRDICEGDTKDFIEKNVDTLNDLIKSNENYVIFGIKESGKTILLDKLLIEILNLPHNDIIPVFIDFLYIKTDIEKNCREFWGKSKMESKNIISKNNVILLIDNIRFSDDYKEQLNSIMLFLEQNNNVRFIATCTEVINNELNLSPELQSLLNFSRIDLRQLKAKQIRELAKKWLSSRVNVSDKEKKINILVNTFSSFDLPRTPFTVSMLLWILERQETYKPQNNALLIENFVEEILKSKDPKGGLRETFDYKNRIRLLSDLSFEMLIADNINYSLPYSTVIKLTEDYLEKRNFKTFYNAKKIIDDFIDLSLFILNQNVVCFRFSCFFEYFLSKKMEFSNDFKEYVMNEENYLRFSNEIINYTGINRGDKDILKTIINRLEYDYIDINDIVFRKIESVDNFFNVDKSLIQYLKADDLLNVLPEKITDQEKECEEDHKMKSENNGGVIKRKDSNKFSNYGKLLLLSMNVLKNSEEIDELGIKYLSYEKVLKNSISYTVLYRLICEEIIKHTEKFPKDRIDDFKFVLRFLPVLHQVLVSDNLGTFKLSEIIKNKIENDKVSKLDGISEFEKFISVFLYADIRGAGYKQEMIDFIKTFNRKYIADACFFKLLSYYHNSNEKSWDNTLLNLLGDLHSKMNSSYSTKNKKKGNLIKQLKRDKEKSDDVHFC